MKLLYRSEIDGLRAIAVLSVIFYHFRLDLFGINPFKGGYIGVDIFFVISGFLIFSLINLELKKNQNLNLFNFYVRRLRRIIPPLLFVILIILPLSYIYLLPNKLIDVLESIFSSLLFFSNYYFYFTKNVYGASDSLVEPFLHTWSLSVEEQFYLFLPLIFILLFKYLKNFIFIFFILIICFSFYYSINLSLKNPDLSFYSIHTRIWELGIGCLLALISEKKKLVLSLKFRNLLPKLGILMILYPLIFYNHDNLHSPLHNLVPVFGTSLIILFSNNDELITKFLKNKLLVGIGLISYSLYLWHYPILSIARNSDLIQMYSLSILSSIFFLILFILLSLLTFYLVEKPSRDNQVSVKKIFIAILISYILILTSIFVTKNNEGFKGRFSQLNFAEISLNNEQTWDILKNNNLESCIDIVEGCKFGATNLKKVFLVGDSQMASLSYGLKDKIIEQNYQFHTYLNNCGIIFPEFDLINSKTGRIVDSPFCTKNYFNQIKNILLKEKQSIFIFGGRYQVYISNKLFLTDNDKKFKNWNSQYVSSRNYNNVMESFTDLVKKLARNNTIFLIYPIPEIEKNVPNTIANKLPKNIFENKKFILNTENFLTTSYIKFLSRQKDTITMLNGIKDKNIIRIYPSKIFCDNLIESQCITHDEKDIFYADDNHLSLKGSDLLNEQIILKLKQIKKNY